MMYQSLYRKYRPQTFSEVYGQDAIATTLTNAIMMERVAHAYLFSGTRGTGKTSSAKLLAKALNCTDLKDGKICGKCDNCLMIQNNSHPDVIEIDAASNNGVDEVRDLIEKVKYAPISGKKKVYIIDEVHMMSSGAFNALLKTLEEPPDHVVFILATTEYHKVLATIKSRCQKFTFKKINTTDIVKRLSYILDVEQCEYEEAALELIASLADGGMRDAISLLEQVMIYSNNDVSVTNTNLALNLIDQENLTTLFNLIMEKDLANILDFIEKIDAEAIDYNQVMQGLLNNALEELMNRKKAGHIEELNFLLNMIEQFDEALTKLKLDNSKKLYLELAIIKTLNYSEISKEQIMEKVMLETVKEPIIEENKPKVKNIPIEKNSLVNKAEIMNILVSANKKQVDFIKSKWSELNNYLLNANTKAAAGMLVDTTPVAASEQAIILLCESDAEVNIINSQASIGQLKNFIKNLYGKNYFCFGVNKTNWQTIKSEYIERLKGNSLPQPIPILGGKNFDIIESIEEELPKTNEGLEKAKELFGDKLILKES